MTNKDARDRALDELNEEFDWVLNQGKEMAQGEDKDRKMNQYDAGAVMNGNVSRIRRKFEKYRTALTLPSNEVVREVVDDLKNKYQKNHELFAQGDHEIGQIVASAKIKTLNELLEKLTELEGRDADL